MLTWILFACPEKESEPVQFNAPDESLVIHVGIDHLEEDVSRSLYSNTGIVEVAQALITPGGGPIGTLHQIQVQIEEDYAETVQEVYIDIDSHSRGISSHLLSTDSAQPSLHVISLESVGDEGEIREDIFTFRLIEYIQPESTEPQAEIW